MTGGSRSFAAIAVGCLLLGFVASTNLPTGASSNLDQRSGPIVDPVGGTPGEVRPGEVQPGVDVAKGPGKVGGPTGKALSCAPGQNGGSTDIGVSGTKIRVASTVVLDGAAASLLSGSPTAMRAVLNKVNRDGGICGRQIELTAVNDSFDAGRGQTFLRNFIDQKYFALTVVPSAEGLSNAISGGDISRAGIPVVGTDGMRIEQYGNQWVWPVATATVSTMRIMAKYGFEKHAARKFAIVYDSTYRFGLEGAKAFEDQVKQLGGKVVTAVPLDAKKSSYGSEVDNFNRACADGCDMVAMLLLPDAARTWMAAGPKRATRYTGAAQTLFSKNFAQQCVQVAGQSCNGIAVWTGFNPPIGALATLPDVARYVEDVRAADPGIDVQNQFVEGAYLGMTLFIEALKKVGPDLTRQKLKEVLDQMSLSTDLGPTLQWRPGNHHANGSARAFSMVVTEGTFTGWRDEGTGFLRDPALEAAK